MQNATAEHKKGELTLKQRQAALCLARGLTIVKTAKEVGVADITIDRWKRRADFQEAIKAAEDELYAEQLRNLKKTAGAAIATLVTCMGEKISPYVRVASASKLLDLGLQVHKISEVEKEVAELRLLVGHDDDFN